MERPITAILFGAGERGAQVYGCCVYKCDNDAVDHQVVCMEFKSGVSATLTMQGHSFEEGRTLCIDGSHATLIGAFCLNRSYLELHDHRSQVVERIDFPSQAESGGHGGGDVGLMQNFVRVMRSEARALTSARESLESHLLAFATEVARLRETVIDMEELRRQCEIFV